VSDDISIPRPTYRVPRHSGGMDPATLKLALIAAGIGGTLLVAIAGWTLLSHRGHGVPVVQADSSPLRVKPVNPGGLQVAGAGNDIFSGGSDTDVEKLAPPPETPDPQGLRAPPPKPAPAPVAVSQHLPEPAPAVAARPPAPPVAPVSAASKPAIAAMAPPARPATAATAAVHEVGGKGAVVQLAALSSEQAARAEWERLVKRWPELFGGHQPAFSRIEHDGQTFWRVRASGFDGVAQATTFCEHLRAKGGGCSVADF
jgi:hypothetical protein